MVVVEVEVVVSQYNKNLPSLSDVVGSSAPDSSLGSESDSASKELKRKESNENISSSKGLLPGLNLANSFLIQPIINKSSPPPLPTGDSS